MPDILEGSGSLRNEEAFGVREEIKGLKRVST